MFVSVIVPVYNREHCINRCLDSLIHQTYVAYEIIVIDDGSTDETGRICDSYSEHNSIIRVFHIEHSGPSKARNLGMDYANGDIIMFCDSDDVAEPEWIENMSSCLKDPNVIMAVSSYWINSGKRKVNGIPNRGLKSSIAPKDYLLCYKKYRINTIWHCCYRKTKCRFKEDLLYGEDCIFNMEYVLDYISNKQSIISYIDKCLYQKHTIDNDSLSKQKSTMILYKEYKHYYFEQFMEKYCYSSEEIEQIQDALEIDILENDFHDYVLENKYHFIKELFHKPIWEKFIQNQDNSRYKRLLSQRSVFLIWFYYKVYLTLCDKVQKMK